MRLFGRKRYWERQRSESDRQHRAGITFGAYMCLHGHPRPPFGPTDDDVEFSWRLGVQSGYTMAEMDAEDDVAAFCREETPRLVEEIYEFLGGQRG